MRSSSYFLGIAELEFRKKVTIAGHDRGPWRLKGLKECCKKVCPFRGKYVAGGLAEQKYLQKKQPKRTNNTIEQFADIGTTIETLSYY